MTAADVRPASVRPQPDVLRATVSVLAVMAFAVVANLTVISRLTHRSAQTAAFDRFRNEIANGIGPLGQVDQAGRLLAIGTPVALLRIPSIGVDEVVVEGTDSRALMRGPGHQRNTVLPGQAGTSVVLGRQAAFGGPFRLLHRLKPGARLTITTQSGTASLLVVDVRRAGDPLPKPLAPGRGRVVLVTATGPPFAPSGVLRVDADTTGRAAPASPLAVTTVARDETPLATDTSGLWVLVLLLQGLICASFAAVWAWVRWGRAKAWVVFFPLILLLGISAADQVALLLPNLT